MIGLAEPLQSSKPAQQSSTIVMEPDHGGVSQRDHYSLDTDRSARRLQAKEEAGQLQCP
jgi:hypothetical protein